MPEMLKSAAFFIFGVLCSPMLFGMFVPLAVYDLTQSTPWVIGSTVISFSCWAIAWNWMKQKKWHYYL